MTYVEIGASATEYQPFHDEVRQGYLDSPSAPTEEGARVFRIAYHGARAICSRPKRSA